MHPDVRHRRRQERRGRHRTSISRLVDIAKPDPVIDKGSERLVHAPTVVAHLGHERKLMEGPPQSNEPLPIFGREAKRPWKLHEQRAEAFSSMERPEPFLKARHLIAVEHTVV